MAFSKEDTCTKVIDTIEEKLNMPKENIKPEATFQELGADSLDIVEIIIRKDAHPQKKWLAYAKTNSARKHIRSYIENNDQGFLSIFKNIGK